MSVTSSKRARYALGMAQDWRCAYCAAPFNAYKEMTIDHVTPMSKGGLDEFQNFLAACNKCNHGKDNTLPDAKTLKKLKQVHIIADVYFTNPYINALTKPFGKDYMYGGGSLKSFKLQSDMIARYVNPELLELRKLLNEGKSFVRDFHYVVRRKRKGHADLGYEYLLFTHGIHKGFTHNMNKALQSVNIPDSTRGRGEQIIIRLKAGSNKTH